MVEAWLLSGADDLAVEDSIRQVMEAMPDPPSDADIPERTRLAHQRFQGRIGDRNGILRRMGGLLKYVAGIAAVFLLCLGGISIYNHYTTSGNKPQTARVFHASTAAITKITLADSSIVRLFPGTTLTVSAAFGIRDRQVSIDGRGYFEVTHDAGRPFYVKAGPITTTVVGTAFEVNNSDTVAATITVREGKVNVSAGPTLLSSLTHDREITINKVSGAFTTQSVDAAASCGWVGGNIDFRQVPLREILQTLGPWYGASFRVLRPALPGKRLTFFVRRGTLKESMDVLSAAGGFHYRIDQDSVLIQ